MRKEGAEGSPDPTVTAPPLPHLLSVASEQALVPWRMPWTCPPSLCPFCPSPSYPNRNVALPFSFNASVSRCLLTFLKPATNLGHVLEESDQKNRKSVCALHSLRLSQVQDTLTMGGSGCAPSAGSTSGAHVKQPPGCLTRKTLSGPEVPPASAQPHLQEFSSAQVVCVDRACPPW